MFLAANAMSYLTPPERLDRELYALAREAAGWHDPERSRKEYEGRAAWRRAEARRMAAKDVPFKEIAKGPSASPSIASTAMYFASHCRVYPLYGGVASPEGGTGSAATLPARGQ